ncbi:MAG: response regulator [Parcubacteria group bacterium]|nr:response regulator [Parcubacteria group bacterium]
MSHPEKESIDSAQKGAKKLKNILIVDENPDVRSSMARLLERTFRAHVATAGSGEAVLELLRDGGSQSFNLIISDNKMGGINGPEMLEQLRQMGIHLPCIMQSGGWGTQDRVKAGNLGAICLDKPVDMGTLMFIIKMIVVGIAKTTSARKRSTGIAINNAGDTPCMILSFTTPTDASLVMNFLESAGIRVASDTDDPKPRLPGIKETRWKQWWEQFGESSSPKS